MIGLNLYRLVTDIKPLGAVDEAIAECNYTPYNIFVMETRLFPMLFQMFGDVQITFESSYHDGRMELFLVIRKFSESTDPFVVEEKGPLVNILPEQMTQIQNQINFIRANDPDYALINSKELFDSMRSNISFTYFQKMLQFTGLDSSYNPYIQPEGIYLSFNPRSDYKLAYREVCKFLIDRVDEFYQKGTIYLESSSNSKLFISNWKLQSIEEGSQLPHLYQADPKYWNLPGINITDFLIQRLQGETIFSLPVSDNLVERHQIAEKLRTQNIPFEFEAGWLKVEVDNLEQVHNLLEMIQNLPKIWGQVMVITGNRLSEMLLYTKFSKDKGIFYNYNGRYMFSYLLSEYSYDLDSIRLQFRNFAIENLTNVSKISKFKNMSAHDIIEQEYS